MRWMFSMDLKWHTLSVQNIHLEIAAKCRKRFNIILLVGIQFGLVLYSSKIQSLQLQCSDSMHRSIEQFVSMYINLGYNFVG